MKKWKGWSLLLIVAAGLFGAGFFPLKMQAKAYVGQEPVISKGIYVEGMDMSGMTREEAQRAVEGYVQSVIEKSGLIHIMFNDVAEETVSAAMLGAYWSNPDLVEELMHYGNVGHVVDRYKARKKLEANPLELGVEITFDESVLQAYIEDKFTRYNQQVQHMHLQRKDEAFQVIDGTAGYELDVAASTQNILNYLNKEWDREQVFLSLDVQVVEPKGTREELLLVKDVLGSFTSSYAGGSQAKVTNIKNGAHLIDAITMYPGDEFSFDAYAAPYTIEHGFAVGQAYESGRLVDSVGGGICQVSSTLYNAILRAELEVTMRYNHSMIVGYVPISSDATLAETSGKDLRFRNNLDTPIYIEAYTTKDHRLIVNIYGQETRPSNRTVEYVSETVEVINPPPDVINTNGTLPVGHIQVSSAYTGYKAKLWKVVKINGVEESRELVNSSNYRAVARMATVGMYTTDPAVLQKMNDAVATGNIDHVQNVIAGIFASPAASYDEE